MRSFKRFAAIIAAVAMLASLVCGCGTGEKDSIEPQAVQWAEYIGDNDWPFLPKNIFTFDLYENGIVPIESDGKYRVEIRGENSPEQAVVLAGEYGKCYEVSFWSKTDKLRIARVNTDPRTLGEGSVIEYSADESVRYYSDKPGSGGFANFMYVCREESEYLIIYTGEQQASLSIDERTMLQDSDIEDNWWIPTQYTGNIDGKGVYALGDYRWSGKQVLAELYDPYMEKYPDYISKVYLGQDESRSFPMYGYIYEPEGYETTMFLTSGTHPTEETAYFALARFMQMVCDATPDDMLLYTLRHKVRFIVVPIINVWGVSQNHDGTAELPRSKIRYNISGGSLNQDFDDLSQQESKNVYNFFKQYAEDIDIAMDFHAADTSGKNGVTLYYNFINYTPNAVANYKTTNHMHHRFMELGYSPANPNLSKIPGSYTKSSAYLEGRLWNEFRVPTITIEHVLHGLFPDAHSSESMSLAVEIFGNFIVQNALFFISNN